MRTTALLLTVATTLLSAHAQSKDWLPTWGTAVMTLPSAAGAAATLPLGKEAVTLRQVVHISQGGKRLRVTFTNEFGTTPLRIDSAHVAFQSAASKILLATDRPLTFNGQSGVTIPAGQFVSSDAVKETIPIFSDVVISTVLPAQPMSAVTYHAAAYTTTYIARGNHAVAEQFLPPTVAAPGLGTPNVKAPLANQLSDKTLVQTVRKAPTATDFGASASADVLQTTSWYFLKDVQVDRTRKSAAIVALGDSITDGAGSTTETNRRWPDILAPLLAANSKTAALSVINMGIGGNRVLHDGTGPSAKARFDRDALGHTKVRAVLMLEGINDIGNMHRSPADAITQQELVDAFTALATQAHAQGVRFIVATILPYGGAKYFSPDGEVIRQNVNAFLRTSPAFDGVVDFDKAMQDPQHPDRLLPKFDHGDHLHPSDEGYAAMAAAVNLKLLRRK